MNRSLYLKEAFIIILIALAAFVWNEWPMLVRVEEDVRLAIRPSPQLAYEFGERHFNAQQPGMYDITRASRLFSLAASLDPTLPSVNHELARIDFLKGNFNSALAKINFQIAMHGDDLPNSYYIRGLIEGYMGDYSNSAKDYEHYLAADPTNWAAINDYAWVLLKSGRPRDAAEVTATGISHFPDNAWLLNTNAVAMYEIGDLALAYKTAEKAQRAVQNVTLSQWLKAYPGNDPMVATEGVAALKASVDQNMHTITLALASSTVQ